MDFFSKYKLASNLYLSFQSILCLQNYLDNKLLFLKYFPARRNIAKKVGKRLWSCFLNFLFMYILFVYISFSVLHTIVALA